MIDDALLFDSLVPFIKNFGSAVDVGAHIGEWTTKMAASFETVYAFEPNIELYNRIASRTCCSCNNIRLYNIALLDFNGFGNLYREEETNKPRSFFVQECEDGDIEVRRLDSFRVKDCGLIKIDVEGGEMAVLQGARKILRRQRPLIVVEYKPKTAARFGWNLPELFTYMRELGYKMIMEKKPNLVFAI